MTKKIARTKLTKAFLFSLPENVRIVSNTYKPTIGGFCMPCFDEIVESSKTERQAQWERIKAAGTNGRLCNIFDSA